MYVRKRYSCVCACTDVRTDVPSYWKSERLVIQSINQAKLIRPGGEGNMATNFLPIFLDIMDEGLTLPSCLVAP